MSVYDLGPHEPRRERHTDRIRNLREFIDLPWTLAWRDLQKMVVGIGMTAKDNPVPKVLSWTPGTNLDGLTREWAQRVDRHSRARRMGAQTSRPSTPRMTSPQSQGPACFRRGSGQSGNSPGRQSLDPGISMSGRVPPVGTLKCPTSPISQSTPDNLAQPYAADTRLADPA